jgi:hypothetical protein
MRENHDVVVLWPRCVKTGVNWRFGNRVGPGGSS